MALPTLLFLLPLFFAAEATIFEVNYSVDCQATGFAPYNLLMNLYELDGWGDDLLASTFYTVTNPVENGTLRSYMKDDGDAGNMHFELILDIEYFCGIGKKRIIIEDGERRCPVLSHTCIYSVDINRYQGRVTHIRTKLTNDN